MIALFTMTQQHYFGSLRIGIGVFEYKAYVRVFHR